MVNPSRIFYVLLFLSIGYLATAQEKQSFEEAGWQQRDSMIATLYQGGAYQVVGVMIEDAYNAEKNRTVVNPEALAVFSMWQGIRNFTDQNLEEAEKYLQESIVLFQSLDQPMTNRYLDALMNMADLQAEKQNPGEHLGALDMTLTVLEKDVSGYQSLYHSVLLQALESSIQYREFDRAQEYGRKALRFAQDSFSNQSDEYFQALAAVGRIYLTQGETRRASNLILQAYELAKKYLPSDHLNRVYYGSNAVNVLKSLGRYPAAEITYLEMLQFFEENSSYKNQNLFPALLDEMGLFYEELGDLDKAYDYYERANVLFALRVERTDPLYIKSQINVGNILRRQKKYTEAEGYYRDALQHSQRFYGENNWSEATLRENLGTIYYELGDYDNALQERKKVKEISEQVWGPNHQEFAHALLNLGKTYAKMGDSENARENLETAYTKLTQLFGQNHFRAYDAAKELASFYQEKDHRSALEKYQSAAEFAIYYRRFILPLFASGDRRELLEDFSQLLSRFAHFTIQHQEEIPEAIEILQNILIQWKGSDTGPDLSSIATYLVNPSDDLRKNYIAWQSVRQKIVSAQSLTIAEQKEADLELTALTDQLKRLQAEIYPAHRSTLLTSHQDGSINRIKSILGPGDLVIDFHEMLAYNPDNHDYSNNGTYLVFLTQGRTSGTRMVQIQLNKNVLETDQLANQTAYFNQIWKPLESYISNTDRLHISPDGYLHNVSFYALPTSSGKMLSDLYQVNIFNRFSSLPSIGQQSSINRVALVGASDYYASDSVGADIPPLTLKVNPVDIAPSVIRSSQQFSRATGTATEITSLADQFLKKKKIVTILTGKDANKIKVHQILQNDRWQLVHLSLPGFFIPKESSTSSLDNTLLFDAGLALSGAQNSWNNDSLAKQIQDDGLLTVQEIYGLNLSGTDLVVMPLLATGSKISGQALAHLKNAVLTAGAKTMIYTLWPLSEKDRTVFLSLFYKNLLKSGSIQDAFTKTQVRLRKKYDLRYWCGFVLIS
jgi:tetratricopeptide (TPR) repeat protein/CHAT domain-containing protein